MSKKLLGLTAVRVFALALGACADEPVTGPANDTAEFAQQEGRGGQDFLLNIIGVAKDKTADMDDNNGHHIFVQLYGGQKVCVEDADWIAYQEILGVAPTPNPYHCTDAEWAGALQGGRGTMTGGWDGLDKVNKIQLTPNTTGEFGVLDANATDADGAEFTMPDNVATSYKVYARALGKPGGRAAITLCGNETEETVKRHRWRRRHRNGRHRDLVQHQPGGADPDQGQAGRRERHGAALHADDPR